MTEWYRITADEVLQALDTQRSGLTASQVIRHRLDFPIRAIDEPKPPHAILLFLRQFRSPFVYLLCGAALLSLLLGKEDDSITIAILLLLNSAIGTIFEHRAHTLSHRLKKKVSNKALVIRDGKTLEVELHHLVIGDCILLQAGQFVPADCRLIESAFLQTDESLLTGEAFPVAKDATPLPYLVPLPEQRNMLFQSTFVVRGSGRAVVTALGQDTVLGTVQEASTYEVAPDSPLIQRISQLNRIIGISAGVLAFLLLVLLLVSGTPFLEAIRICIALIVAVVPEGLPVLVTLTLILGIHKLSLEKALVKNISAVDTLANVDTLITDKTGTLTKNHLEVKRFLLPQEGSAWQGIEPTTALLSGVQDLLEAAYLANDMASLGNARKRFDPAEVAIERLVLHFRNDMYQRLATETPIAVLPFSSEYKLMSATYRRSPREVLVTVKGAGEHILVRCTRVIHNGKSVELTDNLRVQYRELFSSAEKHGQKVLACARTTRISHIATHTLEEELHHLNNLTFLGALALEDPIRSDAPSAIASFQEAGITLKVASGDSFNTVTAVAHSVSLPAEYLKAEQTIQTAPLAHLRRATLFSRVSPLDKVTLAKRLQQGNHVVAMVGDGANDAAALQRADVGITLAEGGSDTARNAADIILTHSSLTTIVHAIKYGRVLTRNLRHLILFLVCSNAAEALVIVLGTMISGGNTVLLPTQILWLNLLSDTPLALPLSFEPGGSKFLSKVNRTLLVPTPRLQGSLIGASIAMICTSLIVLAVTSAQGQSGATQQTALIQSLIASQIGLLFVIRSGEHSVWRQPLKNNPVLLGTIAAVLTITLLSQNLPAFREFLHLSKLPFASIALIWLLNLAVPIVAEVVKRQIRNTA